VLADPACADWGRSSACRFGMRDGEESVVRREVLGALAEPIDLATLPNEEIARARDSGEERVAGANDEHATHRRADESAAPLRRRWRVGAHPSGARPCAE